MSVAINAEPHGLYLQQAAIFRYRHDVIAVTSNWIGLSTKDNVDLNNHYNIAMVQRPNDM